MAAPPLAPGLARKVKKVLEMRTGSPEVLDALKTLSSLHGQNTAASRRHLRTTVEREGLSINQQYLQSAEAVVQALAAVQHDLGGVTEGCHSADASLASSMRGATDMLSALERLRHAQTLREQRSHSVQRFLERYQLPAADVAALQSDVIDDAYFAALERVRVVRANCRALLRTHHQRGGLELVDVMSAHQEGAYERLCRWVQSECRTLSDADAPEVDPLLQKAARALREQPALFKYCAEEVAQARHNAMFQRFIAALTRGGPGGMPRPMEMHAHDPRRYLGDMLAWVHQALAGERELLAALFGEGEAGGGKAAQSAGAPSAATLLDAVTQGVCRPLRVRIEQVLTSSPSLLLCFSVSQLLAFYGTTMDALLGSSGQLTQTLAECHALATRVFHEQLKGRRDRLLRAPPQPPGDLSAPPQVNEMLHQLVEVASLFERGFDAQADRDSAADFEPVLAAMLDPLLQACERSAHALSREGPVTRAGDAGGQQDPAAQHIYLLNCTAALQAAVSQRGCCISRAKPLAQAVQGHLGALVSSHVGGILGRCRLGRAVDRIREFEQGDAAAVAGMATDPDLASDSLSAGLQALFQALSSNPLPELQWVQVPQYRAEAQTMIAQSLLEAYTSVFEVLAARQEAGKQSEVAPVLRHTPAQIRTILGII